MIDGSVLIGAEKRRKAKSFSAVDAATGNVLEPPICEADIDDVRDACAAAASAAPSFGRLEPRLRALLLEAIADQIALVGDVLLSRAAAETGLRAERLTGERARTSDQLRLFAKMVRSGNWLDATIDHAAVSEPRADVRRLNIALGPVAVFGAANFPLAFSVAGGDTASALAAGCPVIVKGHPAHPGTGELVARAIGEAISSLGLDPGIFSYLPGSRHDLGAALVQDPRVAAVGFTGSRAGGEALARLVRQRENPIPIYAEMSSINPVILLPTALATAAATLAKDFVASLTLGEGQYCTNPGLVIAIDGPDLDRFVDAAARLLGDVKPGAMLSASILANFVTCSAAVRARPGVVEVATGPPFAQGGGRTCLFAVSASRFINDVALRDEVFGPASIIVRCRNYDEVEDVIACLDGQLTGTIHAEPGDRAMAARLIAILSARVGRIVYNSWPTGVAVCNAMIHGGPYPSSSDLRTTSVGLLAINRFLRPVAYQNVPACLLPPGLRDDNPWEVRQSVDEYSYG